MRDLTLEEIRRFPDYEDPNPEYIIGTVSDLVVLPSGDIAIVDKKSSKVHILSLEGALKTTIGQAGQGPGEFSGLNRLAVDSDSRRLWVADNRGIHAFSLDTYEFIEFFTPSTIAKDLVTVGNELFLVPYTSRNNEILHVYGSDGQLKRTIGVHLERDVQNQGVQLHTSGWSDVYRLEDDSLRIAFAYSLFNDIIIIDDNGQRTLHLDDRGLKNKHRENIAEARRWDQIRDIIPTKMISRIDLHRDRFFLATNLRTTDHRIFEVDYNGVILNTWRIPLEKSYIRSLHVIEEADTLLFITLDIRTDDQVIIYQGISPTR